MYFSNNPQHYTPKKQPNNHATIDLRFGKEFPNLKLRDFFYMVTCQERGVNGVGLNVEHQTQRTLPRWISHSLVKSSLEIHSSGKARQRNTATPRCAPFHPSTPSCSCADAREKNTNKVFYTYAAASYVHLEIK